jgi:hypothetical protein
LIAELGVVRAERFDGFGVAVVLLNARDQLARASIESPRARQRAGLSFELVRVVERHA